MIRCLLLETTPLGLLSKNILYLHIIYIHSRKFNAICCFITNSDENQQKRLKHILVN